MLGDNAFVQPGSCSELMLHETAVSWIRERLGKTVPRKPWEENRQAYATRLKECCDFINANYNVEGLCRELLQRVNKVLAAKGGPIDK
eukprot:4819307-Karenia_brevis.AAC.1